MYTHSLHRLLPRIRWGFGTYNYGGSYVQADCGAIQYIAEQHHFVANDTLGAAAALNAGTTMECVAVAVVLSITGMVDEPPWRSLPFHVTLHSCATPSPSSRRCEGGFDGNLNAAIAQNFTNVTVLDKALSQMFILQVSRDGDEGEVARRAEPLHRRI